MEKTVPDGSSPDVIDTDHSIGHIVGRFQRWATDRPDAVALAGIKRSLTYREMDRLTDVFAANIASATTCSVVAVSIADRFVQVAMFLAVAKAGKAYWPIHPGTPVQWTRENALRCDCELIVSDGAGFSDVFALHLSPEDVSSVSAVSQRLEPALSGDTALYVNFTSGTTGDRKCVLIPHRGVTTLAEAMSGVVDFERVLHHSSVEFDASTFEIWCPLLNGRTCAIPDMQDGAANFGETVCSLDVDCIWMTSAQFNSYVDLDVSFASGLKSILVGGDVVSPKHIGRLYEANRSIVAFNGYGPTENTTFTAVYRIPRDFPFDGSRTIPIGRPIRGETAFVLDADSREVPVDGQGFLHIGGAGLALGYLTGRGELQRPFVRYADVARGQALYNSGDLVRKLADGSFEFLGRKDMQVKVRGFRVDVLETCDIVRRLAGVDDAVIFVAAGDSHEKQLICAYKSSSRIEERAIRARLSETTPSHMIPEVIVRLDDIPYNGNGKVDKSAITAHIERKTGEDSAASEDVDDDIRSVREIWAELLGRSVVNIDADLIKEGANSLLIMAAMKKLKNVHGVKLPMKTAFASPTIRSMADGIKSVRGR